MRLKKKFHKSHGISSAYYKVLLPLKKHRSLNLEYPKKINLRIFNIKRKRGNRYSKFILLPQNKAINILYWKNQVKAVFKFTNNYFLYKSFYSSMGYLLHNYRSFMLKKKKKKIF